MSIRFIPWAHACGWRAGCTAGLVAVLSAAGGANAAAVDPAASSIVATFKQMKVPVDGTFHKFTADVRFDPASPQAGAAHIDIDIASFDIGSEEYNANLREKEWFDAAAYPRATFTSTSISAAGAGKYTVGGKLTIKGKTADVTVPVAFSQRGSAQVFDGTLPVSRLQFGIGTGEWKDTSVVADQVLIKFHLVAPAAK